MGAIMLLFGSVWSRFLGFLGAAWAWATKNPMAALVALSLASTGLSVWYAQRERENLAAQVHANAGLRSALTISDQSIADLQVQLAKVNLATMRLGKDSASAQAIGARNDDAALSRSGQRAAAVSKIVVPGLGPVIQDCRTSDPVMAAQEGT